MKEQHPSGTITVTGTGLVMAAPDEAVVDLSIIVEAKTAAEASQGNAKITEAVVAAVTAEPNHGVVTRGLSVQPMTKYDRGVATIVGFRAANGVVVRTKVGYAGQIFDAGIGAGANQSSGIAVRLQDERPQREQALRHAVEVALADASVVAKAANVALDGTESIEIDPGSGHVAPVRMLRAEAADTPVIPGDLTVSATVRIVLRTTCK